MDGFIHSVESFGTVDGPGLRSVVFCQGCPMRCQYCHNPDSWEAGKGTRVSPQALIAQMERNKAFYGSGGLTVTGGEPLLQIDFLLELFRLCREKRIHTCIDTSGATYREGRSAYNDKLDELMDMTDLVMLDIKHIEPDKHRALTGMDNTGILAFARYLERRNVPVWIRHVVVPGVTDDEEALARLGRFIGGLRNVTALDVLPYHTMGAAKYEKLGIPYPLAGTPPMSRAGAERARDILLKNLRAARRELKTGKCTKKDGGC